MPPRASQFIGVEYAARAPDGIKYEASVGLSEGRLIGDARFTLCRGNWGKRMLLWTRERAEHGLHSRSKVIDIREISKPSDGQVFMERCFRIGSKNVYASGIMGIAKNGITTKAWGIESTSGRIVELSPKGVACESGDYDARPN